jgi:hypothetical protein
MGAEHVDARTVPFVRLRVLDWLCALSLSKRELCASTASGHMVRRAHGHHMIRGALGLDWLCALSLSMRQLCPSTGSGHIVRQAQGT